MGIRTRTDYFPSLRAVAEHLRGGEREDAGKSCKTVETLVVYIEIF